MLLCTCGGVFCVGLGSGLFVITSIIGAGACAVAAYLRA